VRQYVNLIITMLLGGLWHGASLNFIVWGGMHGVALAVHKWVRENVFHHDKHYRSRGLRWILSILLTFHFVTFCWIFFRNRTFEASWTMINQIMTNFHSELFVQVVSGYWVVFAIMLLGYLTHFTPDRLQERFLRLLERGGVVACALLIVTVIYVVIQVKSSEIQPFIYFQF